MKWLFKYRGSYGEQSGEYYLWYWFWNILKFVAKYTLYYQLSNFCVSYSMIPTSSMTPTVLVNDTVIWWSSSIFKQKYRIGDVIVIKVPGTLIPMCKRIIAKGGDYIIVKNGRVIINGKMLPLSYKGKYYQKYDSVEVTGELYCEQNGTTKYNILLQKPMGTQSSDNSYSFMVPKGHYFLMGDNSTLR